MEQIHSNSFEEVEMKHPAYHLRTNKAVDRLLLVNVLRAIDPTCREYTYYSLAGPFLEDLRVMDHFFPEMKLVSLESNQQTYNRQIFNKFSSRLDLRRRTFADFLLHDYQPASKDVFWLDYTDLKYERLEEFQSLLQKVLPGSVVRITLRAAPELEISSIQDRLSSGELNRIKTELLEKFKNEFDAVLSQTPNEKILVRLSEFASVVQLMVQRAASLAVERLGTDLIYLPIQSTRYIDGTQMLSITSVVCKSSEIDAFKQKLQQVRFANLTWDPPIQIDIPALSLKERLHLEPYLPVPNGQDAGELLHEALKFMIDDSTNRSKQQLSHYADCQRDYPNFVRISM